MMMRWRHKTARSCRVFLGSWSANLDAEGFVVGHVSPEFARLLTARRAMFDTVVVPNATVDDMHDLNEALRANAAADVPQMSLQSTTALSVYADTQALLAQTDAFDAFVVPDSPPPTGPATVVAATVAAPSPSVSAPSPAPALDTPAESPATVPAPAEPTPSGQSAEPDNDPAEDFEPATRSRGGRRKRTR